MLIGRKSLILNRVNNALNQLMHQNNKMSNHLLTLIHPELSNLKKMNQIFKWISTILTQIFLGQSIIQKASFSIMLIQQTFALKNITMVFTLGNLEKMDSNMVLVLFFISTAVAIKEILFMMKRREKVFSTIKMGQHILDSSKMDLKKAKEFSSGAMEKFMMDNGQKVEKMEVECGKVLQETHIWENGRMVELKDLGY